LVLGPVTGTVDLSLARAKLLGEAALDFAAAVAGAGDVDADGHDDLLVGASANDSAAIDAGATYLVLGPVTGTLGLADADAKLVGEAAGDGAGWSVAGTGDVDADGHADLLIGAPYDDEGSKQAGAVYVV